MYRSSKNHKIPNSKYILFILGSILLSLTTMTYTANVSRQTTDKLLFSYAIITGENV